MEKHPPQIPQAILILHEEFLVGEMIELTNDTAKFRFHLSAFSRGSEVGIQTERFIREAVVRQARSSMDSYSDGELEARLSMSFKHPVESKFPPPICGTEVKVRPGLLGDPIQARVSLELDSDPEDRQSVVTRLRIPHIKRGQAATLINPLLHKKYPATIMVGEISTSENAATYCVIEFNIEEGETLDDAELARILETAKKRGRSSSNPPSKRASVIQRPLDADNPSPDNDSEQGDEMGDEKPAPVSGRPIHAIGEAKKEPPREHREETVHFSPAPPPAQPRQRRNTPVSLPPPPFGSEPPEAPKASADASSKDADREANLPQTPKQEEKPGSTLILGSFPVAPAVQMSSDFDDKEDSDAETDKARQTNERPTKPEVVKPTQQTAATEVHEHPDDEYEHYLPARESLHSYSPETQSGGEMYEITLDRPAPLSEESTKEPAVKTKPDKPTGKSTEPVPGNSPPTKSELPNLDFEDDITDKSLRTGQDTPTTPPKAEKQVANRNRLASFIAIFGGMLVVFFAYMGFMSLTQEADEQRPENTSSTPVTIERDAVPTATESAGQPALPEPDTEPCINMNPQHLQLFFSQSNPQQVFGKITGNASPGRLHISCNAPPAYNPATRTSDVSACRICLPPNAKPGNYPLTADNAMAWFHQPDPKNFMEPSLPFPVNPAALQSGLRVDSTCANWTFDPVRKTYDFSQCTFTVPPWDE